MNNDWQTLKQEYDRKGFVTLRKFFSSDQLAELDSWSMDVMNWPETANKWFKYFELIEQAESRQKTRELSKVENFVAYHDGFHRFVHAPELDKFLTYLMGEPVGFFKEKLNVKLPGGAGYRAHQDAPGYFHIQSDAITLFIAIDPIPVESGCLYFPEGGQAYDSIMAQNEDNRALSPDLVESLDWSPVECEPGDMIVFSSYTPHYSLKNVGRNMRRALFLTYGKKCHTAGMTKQYYDDKRESFPQDCEKIPGFDYTQAAAVYSYSSPAIKKLDA